MPGAVMGVTVADFRAYAESMGVDLTDKGDVDCMVLLVRASAFIDSKEADLRGVRTDRDQEYAYPRKGLFVNGFKYRDDEIPDIAKRCLMALAIDARDGDLFENTMDLPVVEERVEGAVTVKYAAPTTIEAEERNSVGMALLRQLMMARSMSIPLVRV